MEEQTPLQNPEKPQRWGNYFKEFLMLFLAISLGFWVENLREDFAEKDLEHEFMKEIVDNLVYDTVRCTNNMKTNEYVLKGLDSFRVELRNARNGNVNLNRLYYFAFRYRGQFGRAVFNTSAMTELKHSGSLRLIKDMAIKDALTDYYERKVVATNHYIPNEFQIQPLQKARNDMFSMLPMEPYLAAFAHYDEGTYEPVFNFNTLLKTNPEMRLLKSKPEDFEHYYTLVSEFEMSLRYYYFWLKLDKKAAKSLMAKIRKEYHFQ